MLRYLLLIAVIASFITHSGNCMAASQEDMQEEFYQALTEGKKTEVARLIAGGIQADGPNWQGRTPLMLASQHGYSDIVKLLLAKKARVDARDDSGSTPLMFAARGGQAEIIRLLLAGGAKVNDADSGGRTPLMYACSGGEVDAIRLLLASGANIEARDAAGNTPLMLSVDDTKVAKLLAEKGANREVVNNDGENLLIYAVKRKHISHMKEKNDILANVRSIIAYTRNLEARDKKGNTALITAFQSKEILDLLIKSGADVNARNFIGESALMLAANGNYQESVTVLLKGAANLELADISGHTALWYASHCSIGCDQMEKLLKEHGAKDEVAKSAGNGFPCEQVKADFTFDLPGATPLGKLLFLPKDSMSLQVLVKTNGFCRQVLSEQVSTYDLAKRVKLKTSDKGAFPDIVIKDQRSSTPRGRELFSKTYFWNGNAYEQKGYRESAELNRKALSLPDDKLPEAIALWNKAYELVRDGNVEMVNNLGDAYYRQGIKDKKQKNFQYAELYLREAAGRDKRRWQANLNLGDLYRATGKKSEAIEEYAKALQLCQNKGSASKIQKKMDALQASPDTPVLLQIVKQKTSESLPAFTFKFLGDPETKVVNSVTVTDTSSGKQIQDLQAANDYEEMESPPGDDFFTLEDINFDGYKDLGLVLFWGGTGNTATSYWLFNPKTKQFAFSKDYDSISTHTLDPKRKQINTHSNGGHAGMIYSDETYEVRNNKPVLIREVSQDYDEKKGYYVEETRELVKGKLKVVSKKKIAGP